MAISQAMLSLPMLISTDFSDFLAHREVGRR